MFKIAYEWSKERYPKEHLFVKRLWKACLKNAPVLTVIIIAALVIPTLIGGIYLGTKLASTTVNIANNIPAPDIKPKNIVSSPVLDDQPGPDGELSFIETVIRFERDRSSPHLFAEVKGESRNIYASFQLWDFKPMVVFHEFASTPGALPPADIAIKERRDDPGPPPHPEQVDTFVIWFAKPTKYSGFDLNFLWAAIPAS
jgi:hypothetical protein